MSNKQSKKVRKVIKSEIKKLYPSGVEVLQKLIKQRPKYCPKFIWILLFMPIFKKVLWKSIYKRI
jgi:hypothetical protein